MDATRSTPRRSQRIQHLDSASSPAPNPTKLPPSLSTKMATRRSPLLPSSLETMLLLIYPTTLIIGSLFGLLDPATRASPYNATTQSHYANTAPSYFAKKNNLFNQLFVKKGWAWVTLSYIFFLMTNPSTGPVLSLTRRRIQSLMRYAIVTVWWIFVTQWFFGPAIIDRGFVLTGGQCELVEQAELGNVDMDETRQFVTGLACKSVGGKWAGGHDISGHVFLLVLGSMFLFEEVLHVVWKARRGKEERTVYMYDGALKSAEVESQTANDVLQQGGQWTIAARAVLAVGTLSVYMLLMTAAYFHTWFEKFTGLLVAFSAIFVVYFVPRALPAFRAIVGMPGI